MSRDRKAERMDTKPQYVINLDNKYGYSTVIDIPPIVTGCTDTWFNQTLTQVNDAVIRLGIIEGEFHFHAHDEEDEFFLVLEGKIYLDLEGGKTVELSEGQGYTVPKRVVHRPRAPERAVILMVEKASVKPTGD